MSRNYRENTIKKLWGLSAGRCAYPGCQVELIAGATDVDPEQVIGYISHIVAHSSDGPRANPNFPEEQKDEYSNLLLLCGHHHTLVDKQPNSFTIQDLTRWKYNHEEWIKQCLAKNMPNVNFPELNIITSAMLDRVSTFDTNYTLIDPRSKMKKNELSDSMSLYITMGLSKSRDVAEFIQQYSTIDQEFPNKIKSRFVTEYERLRYNENLQGDELLLQLIDYASLGSVDFKQRCAGLAVLGYLFERCEVFEK